MIKIDKIGMFSLMAIAIAVMGVATMSSFVVSAAAQPAGTIYCAKTTGPPSGFSIPCFSTKEDCQAYADAVAGHQVCTPIRH
jgi:hypothetical protein